MTTTTTTTTATARLARYIAEHGNIRTARVSSAQAKGNAGRYSYWGATRYELRISSRGGRLVNVALERARSDRRSVRLVQQDLKELCEREGRIEVDRIGQITEGDAARILSELGIN